MLSAAGVREQCAGEKSGTKNGEGTRGWKTLIGEELPICSPGLILLTL